MSTAGAATPQAAARARPKADPQPGRPAPTPQEAPRPAGAHAAAPRHRARLSPGGALLLVVVTLLLVAAIAPVRNLMNQRGQMRELQRQALTLQRQNTVLQARVNQLNDPLYLEQLARRCLGMVRPGEIAFVVIPKHGTPTPSDC
jgi:cell division protein FtsB